MNDYVVERHLEEFNLLLQTKFELDEKLCSEARHVLAFMQDYNAPLAISRKSLLLAQVNRKFAFNQDGITRFLAEGAKRGVTFNYHEKLLIQEGFDSNSRVLIQKALVKCEPSVAQRLLGQFNPINDRETVDLLHAELESPTLIRKDSKPRDWSLEILTSLFFAFLYDSFPELIHHKRVSSRDTYTHDYWEELHSAQGHLFSRDKTLVFVTWDVDSQFEFDYRECLRKNYAALSNHGYIAFWIRSNGSAVDPKWSLFGDLVLYAEKHIEEKLNERYFRHESIRDETLAYLPFLSHADCKFEIAAHGYQYKDCFVLGDNESILVVLQKNHNDKTLIPCPKCRSENVRSNSYSTFGVKSWECSNQVCADRTKFNRGKRYSFLQMLKARAIQDDRAKIPTELIRQWSRDVQVARSEEELIEMMVRFYSLPGDSVELVGTKQLCGDLHGRTATCKELPRAVTDSTTTRWFDDSPFFARFVINDSEDKLPTPEELPTELIGNARCIFGDSSSVLKTLPSESVDGAVTSPPYYNAREYSQWPNIYCYLHDMHLIAEEVFRVLRPGTFYLYNIFDYFDNERTIALSAMGDKRMILGAYTLHQFQEIGFQCVGNVIWDKGQIEGKRAFNGGNPSPYYQSPFNCWEHIFVFQKPGAEFCNPFPRMLVQKPVFKLIGGTNVHGHTAPFPEAIPRLLAEKCEPTDTILDPFAGSMTTGLVANERGLNSILIEKDKKYFKLGCKKLKQAVCQKLLF